jgi:ubiquinone/menaquinone biosynthesis C-methylase UbiE
VRKPDFIARQGRCPSGLLGHLVARVMRGETAPENEAVLDHLDLEPGMRVLEVGFGHGATLAKAAERLGEGHLAGVDFSDVMVRTARRHNRRHLQAGRMTLDLADSTALPFPDACFDRVFTVHTIYFWAEPERHLAEICRVLDRGGRLVLGFRPAEDPHFAAQVPASIYHVRPRAEVEAAVTRADLRIVQSPTKRLPTRLLALIVAEKP